jgi:RNA polymerase sigma factor (sigma-70 family)
MRRQMDNVRRFICGLAGASSAAPEADVQLLEQFVASRDPAAFETLLQRHGPLVLSVCRRVLNDSELAEDAFQATFLVLVRRAASIARGERLGSWLYGVATRVALKARQTAARRSARQQELRDMPATAGNLDEAECDLRPVLDEEIQQLPARYRVPVVLCYLQGINYREAARQIGCPLGTLSVRLARARELLRGRLGRRGLAVSSAVLAALIGRQTATAALPPVLLRSTLQAASAYATGTTAGAVSAQAALLAESVAATMASQRVKPVVALVLALMLAASSAGLVAFWMADPKPEREPALEGPALAEAQVSDGLKLTLTLDPAETTLPAGADNAEPVKLKVSFTNVGDQSLKVNIWLSRVSLEVVGPEGKPVPLRLEKEKQADTSKKVYHMHVPKTEHPVVPPADYQFPVLMAGKTEVLHEETFPRGAKLFYALNKPGEYRIKALYSSRVVRPPFEGCWIGSVTSNEVMLKVVASDGQTK